MFSSKVDMPTEDFPQLVFKLWQGLNCKSNVRVMLVVLPLVLSFGSKTHSMSSVDSTATIDCETIYVVSHGWHSGIILNRSDLIALVPSLTESLREEEFVEIGWGDERFYQAQTVTPGMAVRAAFWPTSTVLHVVAFRGPPSSYFSGHEVVELPTSKAEYRELVAFVAASFARTSHGAVIRFGPGLYGDSWFYSAEGAFSVWNNCNTWVAKAIEKTGYPISGRRTVTAQGLFSQLQGNSEMECDSAY